MDVGAALSLSVDSSSVLKAANDLDRFAASSEKAAASSAKINFGNAGGSISKLVTLVQSLDSKIASIVGTLDKMASATKAAASANDNLVSSANKTGAALAVADSHVIAYTQHLAALARVKVPTTPTAAPSVSVPNVPAITSFDQLDAHVTAYRKHLQDAGEVGGQSLKKITFEAHDTLNAMRQLSDIGTTLAIGMSPFMVAIEQGPQLLDILQNKAAMTGQTLGAVFRAAAAAIWAALLPLMPYILAIGAVAGTLAAAWGLATRKISGDVGDVTKGMGLAKNQADQLHDHLDRLKDNKIDVHVTGMDTFKAFFVTLGEEISDAVGKFSWLKTAWNDTMDFLTKYGVIAIKFIVGMWMGAISAIEAGWRDFPDVLGDLFLRAANQGIKNVNWLVNKVVDGINAIGGSLDHVDLGQIANPFKGAADGAINAFVKGYDAAGKAVDNFGAKWEANAKKIARQRIERQLPMPTAGPKGPKTDAEKFADLVTGAQNDINTQTARGAAAALSAEAAATLEQKTKLLNEAQSKGITLTDAMRTKINALAAAYGKAKVAADVAIAVQGVIDGLKKQGDAIDDQIGLVGKYGDALTRAKIASDALAKARDALPKGASLNDKQISDILAATKPVADRQVDLDRQTRVESARKDAEDQMYALDLERKGLGLTGAAADAYAYSTEQLNAAKKAGQDLSGAEIDQINAAAAAYGAARDSIDKTAQAISDARDITKGFFTDWIDAAMQGQNVFKAFANSIISALNSIISKMLSNDFQNLFSGTSTSGGLFGSFLKLLGGGGGGLDISSNTASLTSSLSASNSAWFASKGFAKGGAFGTIARFANGGAFTNGIFNSPTLFRFANGGKLGEMGEAGPEAIMPLKRGANGSLGVQVHGGSIRPNVEIHTPITIAQSGSFTTQDAQQMAVQAGQQAVAEVRKNLQSYLQEWQMDGAVSS